MHSRITFGACLHDKGGAPPVRHAGAQAHNPNHDDDMCGRFALALQVSTNRPPSSQPQSCPFSSKNKKGRRNRATRRLPRTPRRSMGAQRSLRAPLQRRAAHARTRCPSRATRGAGARHAFYEVGPRPPLEQGRTPDAEHDQRARREPRGGRRDVGQRQGEETLRRPRAGVRPPSLSPSSSLNYNKNTSGNLLFFCYSPGITNGSRRARSAFPILRGIKTSGSCCSPGYMTRRLSTASHFIRTKSSQTVRSGRARRADLPAHRSCEWNARF